MFSRSVFRSLAADLRLSAQSSISSAAPLRQRACLHQTALLRTQQQETVTQSSSPKPESPLNATPRTQTSQPETQNAPKVPPFDPFSSSTPQTRADVPIAKQPVAPSFDSPLEVTNSLMSRLPHLLGESGVAEVYLQSDWSNILSTQSHAKLGFRVVGRVFQVAFAGLSIRRYRFNEGRWTRLPGRILDLEISGENA